jgi:heme/copper-type cytochrome/quinol oxidase subunit 1
MLTGLNMSVGFVSLYNKNFYVMKKILFSSLMVLTLSFMASAQNKQPSKPATQPTNKTTYQPTQKQPQNTTTTQTQQKSSSTQQKSTAMTKPKHKKHHHKTKHTSTTK